LAVRSAGTPMIISGLGESVLVHCRGNGARSYA
jgi:hypothetical protein